MMTELFLYSIKSAFTLVLLYAAYALLLHHEKCLRRNRLTLLAILCLSLLLPLCNVSSWSMDNQPLVHRAQVQMQGAGIPIHMVQDEADVVEAQAELDSGEAQLLATANPIGTEGTPIVPVADATGEPASRDWFQVVSLLFVLGMTLVLGVRLAQFYRMGAVIRRGSLWQEKVNGIHIYCHSEQVTPFSWLNNIVIGDKDYDRNGREIILHEEGHIRHCHSLDIVLLTVVQMLQWWNPFIFLLARHLRDVHEYEADDYVLRHDIDPHAYQLLLLQSVVHDATFPLASSFNHSLIKNRIKMMSLPQPKAWMRSKVLYVIPLSMLALSVFATPSIIEPIEKTVATLDQTNPQEENKVKATNERRAVTYVTTQTIKGRIVAPFYSICHTQETEIVDLDKNTSFRDETNYHISWCYSEKKHIIKVNGKIYSKDEVPDLPVTAVKRIEFHKEGEKTVINLVTKDFGSDELMIYSYTDSIKGRLVKRYSVRIPKGTWIVNARGKSFIDEVGIPFPSEFERPYYRQGLSDSTIIKIDGVVYNRDSLPKLHYSEMKKAEFYRNPQTINIITKNVVIPDSVKDNVPRVQTIILRGKNHVAVVDSLWTVGDWRSVAAISWNKDQGYNIRHLFYFSKNKPDLKVYIYASTEVTQQTIDRAVGVLDELGIKNYEIIKDIPIYHWTDEQYRAWAEKQKALGVKYSVNALKAKLISEYVDLSEMNDMRRWNRVIRPVFKQ